MGANEQGLTQQGFVTTTLDTVINWTRTGSMWPGTFGLPLWSVPEVGAPAPGPPPPPLGGPGWARALGIRLLWDRDDARRRLALRPRSFRDRVPAESAPVRCHDRRSHSR